MCNVYVERTLKTANIKYIKAAHRVKGWLYGIIWHNYYKLRSYFSFRYIRQIMSTRAINTLYTNHKYNEPQSRSGRRVAVMYMIGPAIDQGLHNMMTEVYFSCVWN